MRANWWKEGTVAQAFPGLLASEHERPLLSLPQEARVRLTPRAEHQRQAPPATALPGTPTAQ